MIGLDQKGWASKDKSNLHVLMCDFCLVIVCSSSPFFFTAPLSHSIASNPGKVQNCRRVGSGIGVRPSPRHDAEWVLARCCYSCPPRLRLSFHRLAKCEDWEKKVRWRVGHSFLALSLFSFSLTLHPSRFYIFFFFFFNFFFSAFCTFLVRIVIPFVSPLFAPL